MGILKNEKKATLRKDIYKDKDGNSVSDAVLIIPDCGCRSGLYLQTSPVGENVAFTWDSNENEPTISPSVYPYADQCDTENKTKRCHFHVIKGVAHHTSDSKYSGAVLPLLDNNTDHKYTTPKDKK